MTRAATLKQQRYRARLKRGAVVLPVEIEPAVVETMLLSGRVSDGESEDRDRLACEVKALLSDWVNRWRKDSGL